MRQKLDDNILESQKQKQLEENDLKNVNFIFVISTYVIDRIQYLSTVYLSKFFLFIEKIVFLKNNSKSDY